MSHIVTVRTQVRDSAAVAAACRRLSWPAPSQGTAKLFAGMATGTIIRLPEWRYPLVCDLKSGELHYDNYGGAWGNPKHLNRFLQAYAVERASIEARRKGYSVVEQPLSDGSIKLSIEVGDAA